jgi:hypothetical protein
MSSINMRSRIECRNVKQGPTILMLRNRDFEDRRYIAKPPCALFGDDFEQPWLRSVVH